MASPRVVIFPIFDATTRAPLTGQTPTFSFYANETGASLTQPSITEVGGGFYKFTPPLQTDHIIVYVIDCGSGADPQYQYDTIRAEDFDGDRLANIPSVVWQQSLNSDSTPGSYGDLFRLLSLILTGRVSIEAGTLTVFAEDGETVFQTQDLWNATGAPGALDATNRSPATRFTPEE